MGGEETHRSVAVSGGATRGNVSHSLTLYNLLIIVNAQLQKVFLPPGTDFLRRNFPNIEEEFS